MVSSVVGGDQSPWLIHLFERGRGVDALPLLLLHGTGGTERDLLALGRAVAPNASLLSPRGQVLENGAPRFFRRFSEGVLDEEDVRYRAHQLADFVVAACSRYGILPPIALGYSNGANMATALLLLRPEILAGAILCRAAQLPLSRPPFPDLTTKTLLLISGAKDSTITPQRFSHLTSFLKNRGAKIELKTVASGHEITGDDVVVAKTWLSTQENLRPTT